MGENSKIEWTDHTMNFWIGCRKVSPACANCYAGTLVQNRMGKSFYPAMDLGRVATDADSPVWRTKTWRDPIKWDYEAREAGTVARVFTCSLSDFFLDHPGVHEWRRESWQVMRSTPSLLWLVLSKRWDLGSEYIRTCLPDDWGDGYPNVMLGATVESQVQVGRIQSMSEIPCAGRFVSIEPMVGPIDLGDAVLDWVIVGGESGSKPRAMQSWWARDVRNWCLAHKTPFHFKQWGEFDQAGARVGKKTAGRILDGRTWDDGPRGF